MRSGDNSYNFLKV